MAGPRPDDNYNPTLEVAPQTGMPDDTLSVRASPSNFGGQVGQAIEQGGDKIKEGADKLFDVHLQQLGLANEHAGQAADLQLGIEGGQKYSEYRSLEGLDASNAKDAFIKDYTDLNAKIRASLGNPAAQRAYDAVATRRMLFTIQEANDYAANQKIKAYRAGYQASNNLAAQEAARYEVATDPAALGDKVGTVIFNLNTSFTAPGGVGTHETIPASTDPKTGRLVYDTNTPQGKNAQAEYNNALAIETDKIYTAASDTIMVGDKDHQGNVVKAVDFLKENQARMSPGTYYHQMAKFTGPYQNEESRQVAEGVVGRYTHDYQYNPSGSVDSTVYATNLGNVKLGNGSFANPTTPVDGVTLAASNLRSKNYQGKTLAQIGATWTGESPEKVNDWVKNVATASGLDPNQIPDMNNPQVLKSLLRGISVAEKLPEDRKAFSDQVISEGVSNALSGKAASLAQGRTPTLTGGIHQSLPDYLGDKLPQIIADSRKEAADRGGDITAQDRAATRAEAYVHELQSGQAGEIRSLRNKFYSKILDEQNPLTNVSSLDYGDPETKADWVRYQLLDSYGASGVRRAVDANAQGRSNSYGTAFYDMALTKVLSGEVKDIAQLQDYFGGDKAPISSSGIRILSKTMEGLQSPEGQAFAHAELQFLEGMKGQVTGTAIYPTANSAILKGNFDKQLMAKLPQIEALKADLTRQGKNPMEMFDPNSKDYIGKDIKPISQDELNKVIGTTALSSMVRTQTANNSPSTAANIPKDNQFDLANLKTADDVGAALKAGKFGYGQEAVDKAHKVVHDKFGGFAPNVPAVQ